MERVTLTEMSVMVEPDGNTEGNEDKLISVLQRDSSGLPLKLYIVPLEADAAAMIRKQLAKPNDELRREIAETAAQQNSDGDG